MTDLNLVNIPLSAELTPQQQADLVVIAEEAAEVVKCSTKLLRFGLAPVAKGIMYNNVKDLFTEWDDLTNAMWRFREGLSR